MRKKSLKLLAVRTGALCLASLIAVTSVWADLELDRRYTLESIGFLKSWDNIDGLFADHIKRAYQEYFSKQSRFALQDVSQADEILSRSKIPYKTLIKDEEILSQLSRSLRVESVIRTRIFKEGPQYRFTLDWFHAPQMELLATHTFIFQEPPGGTIGTDVLTGDITRGLNDLIAKVPYKGHVTGIDNEWVTVNIGRSAKIDKGDVLVISTIERVKRHPLLKTIVGWEFSDIAQVKVEDVDEGVAFGKVIDLMPDRQLARYQKITKVIPAPKGYESVIIRETEDGEEILSAEPGGQVTRRAKSEKKATLGYVQGTFWIGPMDREHVNGSTRKNGGGFLFGPRVFSQVWLTRSFFMEGEFSFGTLGYGQDTITVADDGTVTTATDEAGGGTASFIKGQADLGYSYLVLDDFFGPKVWIKSGFQYNRYGLPAVVDSRVGPVMFNTIFMGFGADMPFQKDIGALLSLDLGLLNFVTEEDFTSGIKDSSSIVSFFLGGYFRFREALTIKLGIDVISHTVSFESTDSATAGPSLTQRVVTFGPTLQYFF